MCHIGHLAFGFLLGMRTEAGFSSDCGSARSELESDVKFNEAMTTLGNSLGECRQDMRYSCNEPTSCYPEIKGQIEALSSVCMSRGGRLQSWLLTGALTPWCWFNWDPVHYDCILPECENTADLAQAEDRAKEACASSTTAFAQAGFTNTTTQLCKLLQTRFSLSQKYLDDLASQGEKWLEEATCENFLKVNFGKCDGPEKTISKISMDAFDVAGTVPPMSLIPHVVDFSAHTNKLSGTIPPLMANNELVSFSLSNNQLDGTVPSFEFNPKLERLFLYENQLSGALPSFVNNTELFYLYVNDNALTTTGPAGSCPVCEVELNGCYLENNNFKFVAPEYTQSSMYSFGQSAVCNARIGASASVSPHYAALVALLLVAATTL